MMSIGQLASSTGVTTSAIRYYEREELVLPADRTEANYRQYSLDAVDTLRFIKAAQQAGFTLPDIRRLLSVRTGQSDTCDEVQALLASRLTKVDMQLETLTTLRTRLISRQRLCRNTKDGKECHAIRRLSVRSRSA